jgi:hypothetical protein
MLSVIFFTDVSEPEIVLLNEIYDYLAPKGITLRVVVFKDYHRCVQKLKCEYIYLGAYSLPYVDIPTAKKRNTEIYNNDFFQKMILLEKEIGKNSEIDVAAYEFKINGLIRFVERLAKVASVYFVMFRSYTAYVVVKEVLANKKINFIPFEKWVFPGTYQFNTYGINQPDLDSDLEVGDEGPYKLLLQNLLSNYKGRHPVPEKQMQLPSKYVLLLLGEGGSSFCLKNADEYWTMGKGWGNDFEVLSKVQQCIQEILPDSKLLVRQHPYTKYKFEQQHISSPNTILADHAELDSLISNADIVLTVPGSIFYYSLAKGKKVIVLGNSELCGTEAVKCADSVDELHTCITEASNSKEAMRINRDKVVEAVMPYFKNQVWLNGERLTYGVLGKYIDDRELTTDNALVWQAEKIRFFKHRAFIYIKSELFAIFSKIKNATKKVFLITKNQTSLK